MRREDTPVIDGMANGCLIGFGVLAMIVICALALGIFMK